ncbi:MAG: CpsD/CapB family tyrosine-protein kinase [Deltaproteobacteria bacterium]|nr:CpsD/CapB family tyrosine-protein kinase [Deltaproteobacteria bacterium]
MKYRILEDDPERKIKALLFCSPRQGEGNSTVLTHFAITLASDGERVFLVDANLRDPSLHKTFDVSMENGLTDLILGQKNLEEVTKPTSYGALWLITSGSPYPNPLQVIDSKAFDSHLEEMKTRAEWVLFDCPSVNSYMDGIALAGKVDGVVMVVMAEKTRWEVAQNMKRKLESSNGKILGVVLNKRRYRVPKWLYKRL